jgi:hypothetical protein
LRSGLGELTIAEAYTEGLAWAIEVCGALVGWSAMRLREVQVEPSTEVGNGTLRRDNAPR